MKKLFIFLLLGMFLISFATASIDYVDENKTYQIDTWLPNWLGGDGESIVKLIDNTDYCLTDCYFTLEFNNERPVSLLEDLNFLDRNGENAQEKLKDLNFQIGKYENTTKEVPIYTTVCEDVYNSTNITQNCETINTENQTVTEEVLIWKEYNREEDTGLSYLKVNAKKSPMSSMDWIVTFRGEDLVKWAWWDSSWAYKREITLTANEGNFSYMNISYYANMKSDFSDVRFLDSTETTELNYTLESKSNSEWAIFRVNNKEDTTFYMYYGNSGASSTGSAEATYFNAKAIYYLDETTGSVFVDSAGYDDNASISGTMSIAQSGIIDYGVQSPNTDAAGNYVSVPSSAIGGLSEFTINMWFYGTSNTWGGTDPGLYYAGADTDFCIIRNSDSTLRCAVTGVSETPVSFDPNNDQWYMLTAVHSGSNTEYFIDGVSMLNITASYSFPSSPGTLRFASWNYHSLKDGSVDEIYLYNKSLSRTEIIELMTQTEPTFTVGDQEQNAGSIDVDFVTPPTPENYANITDLNITVQVNATYTNSSLTNISYDFYNVNGTVTTYFFENETYQINATLPTAHFHYNVTICGFETVNSSYVCSSTETRHLNHDITPPVINLTSPSGTFNYLINDYELNLNWTVTDEGEGVGSCWYEYLEPEKIDTTILKGSNTVSEANFDDWLYNQTTQDKTIGSQNGEFEVNATFTKETNGTMDLQLNASSYQGASASANDPGWFKYAKLYIYNYDSSSYELVDSVEQLTNPGSGYFAANLNYTNSNMNTKYINDGKAKFNYYLLRYDSNTAAWSIGESILLNNSNLRSFNFVNCSLNTTTFNYVPEVNSLTFYANDTFGNIQSNSTSWNYKLLEVNQTYSEAVTEGSLETFLAHTKLGSGYSISDAVLFNYNGTETTGQAFVLGDYNILRKANFLVPSVEADTNYTFYWEVTLSDSTQINLSSKNQTIYNMAIDNCSSYTNEILNFSLVDEETQVSLPNAKIETAINFYDASRSEIVSNYSMLFGKVNPLRICLSRNITNSSSYSMDVIARYENSDHANEYYNIVNQTVDADTNSTKITLYDLNLSDSTEFQLTFTGSDFLPMEGALIYVDRQYISENTFKTVELPKTDYNGQTVLHLVRNDVIYNIRVVKDGVVLGNFESLTAFCDDYTIGDCNIELNAFDSVEAIFNYDTSLGIIFTAPTYNATSDKVSFNFVTDDGSTKTVQLVVTRNDIFGNRSVCNSSMTSSGGTLTCDIDPNLDDSVLKTEIYVDEVLAVSSNVKLDSTGYGVGGYLLFVVMIISFALMFSGSKTGVLISIVLSFAGAVGLSLVSGDLIGLGASGLWLLVIVIIGIIKLNKERNQ